MNEKELLEQLKKSAEEIPVPDSLHPDQIENLLREHKQAGAREEKNREPAVSESPTVTPNASGTSRTRETPEKRRRFSIFRAGALAAAFAVVILASWQAGRLSAKGTLSSNKESELLVPIENGDILIFEEETDVSANGSTAGTPANEGDTDLSGVQNSPVSAQSKAASSLPSETAEESAESTPAVSANEEVLSAAGADTMVREASTQNDTKNPDAADTERETAAEKDFSGADGEPASDTVSLPITASLSPVGDYQTVYQALFDAFGTPGILRTESLEDVAGSSDMEGGFSAQEDVMTAKASSVSYSTTNVQEEGVDEGDFVKTDGSYIYILRKNGSLVIVSADDEKMRTVSHLSFPEEESVQEMYLDGERLSVVTSYYYSEMDTSREDVIAARSGSRTKLYTYDITDRENPSLLGTVTQDGGFCQSRKNGRYLYLFSRYSPVIQDTFENSDLVPKTSRGEIGADNVYLPEHVTYSDYLIATCIDLSRPGEIIDQKAVVSSPETFYASRENIYIANTVWENEANHTEILKLHYTEGTISGVAVGSVEGFLNDSFSLNEYQGILRVVSTSYDENYEEHTGLYLFDPNMDLLGSIEDLAPGETVRSARFLAGTGYFVTFRQTDPLFSVDLTDPKNPKVLGTLKVSGFSDYLHFYSEDLLLGLGFEADEKTGSTTGLKLSMFDISDPAKVTEVHRLVMPGITWCDSFDDYRSILMDPKKNLFGFTLNDRYLVFSYNPEKGFTEELLYDSYNDVLQGIDTDLGYNAVIRGLYINDTFYLVRPGVVTAFDMTDAFRQTGQLKLPQ